MKNSGFWFGAASISLLLSIILIAPIYSNEVVTNILGIASGLFCVFSLFKLKQTQ